MAWIRCEPCSIIHSDAHEYAARKCGRFFPAWRLAPFTWHDRLAEGWCTCSQASVTGAIGRTGSAKLTSLLTARFSIYAILFVALIASPVLLCLSASLVPACAAHHIYGHVLLVNKYLSRGCSSLPPNLSSFHPPESPAPAGIADKNTYCSTLWPEPDP